MVGVEPTRRNLAYVAASQPGREVKRAEHLVGRQVRGRVGQQRAGKARQLEHDAGALMAHLFRRACKNLCWRSMRPKSGVVVGPAKIRRTGTLERSRHARGGQWHGGE